MDQSRAPIMEALEQFKSMRIVPFDVPGHKRGRGNPELTRFLGEQCMTVDVNSMKPLDNLCHPSSVIREAEELAAEAFGAKHAFLMVGGTTSSVQSMILSVVGRGDEIILPRNVHRSVINALVLTGAIPVYVNPQMNERLGISLGMSVKDVKKAIEKHPGAKAVLVNNPTYYGICSDIREIVRLAHAKGMKVLADEAHGTHFYFGEDLPVSAMAAGADLASVSMHKSGGSLTQSSFLLCGQSVNPDHVRQFINLTQTTSGSYLLMVSLDISRKNLALRGKEIFRKVSALTEYAREEINQLGDYYAYSRELINGDTVFDFDVTKLAVNTLDVGLAGIEVYDILRDFYDIQTEFGDLGNLLAYVSVGDRERDLERLVAALSDIRRRYKRDKAELMRQEYISPQVVTGPQEAFYAEKQSLPLENTVGRICAEFVMCYPPGIPILAPGERITKEILDYIRYAKEKNCLLTGTEDPDVNNLQVIKGVVSPCT
ncbi:aminotransferase class I/II-fold pyridoxal phosphate-dependent enzyme [Agathobaculum sp.]|uniref:aminotransferase class I/II-fold pyridoxal phosphate-dependent enzyme n=1 Tax=Agathobaculum sp. TaxID=2048138 RepID=UPI002A83CF24|nr:aminotransferase class I/II-fold pyridoxal phosphate-dependent enzyme [Agathobaculum sp.]MDY3618269.1 aminotransferase class I/II-fold pyridoxal phosphate-dependent enzyme [Agathobaculum sp.]